MSPASHRFATIKDVAEMAQTSTATVSYILNGISSKRYISDELRQRVVHAAKTLGYVKFGAASSLKGKNTDVIAVLSPQYENHFFAGIFSAVERAAYEQGYVLAVLNTFDDTEREKKAINQMIQLRVDGFLIIPTIEGGNNTASVREHNVPCVSVERPLVGVEDGAYDFVASDNFGAVYSLTKHSLELGHKRIALACWDSEITRLIYNLEDRRKGYIRAMQEQGLYDSGLIHAGEITWEEGARLTSQILEDKTVTSIVYGHYTLAEGGIQYMKKKKIKVPRDVSVSLLGSPKWAEITDVDYTRVIQPSESLGSESVEILLSRINGNASDNITKIFSTKLHVGESVASLR